MFSMTAWSLMSLLNLDLITETKWLTAKFQTLDLKLNSDIKPQQNIELKCNQKNRELFGVLIFFRKRINIKFYFYCFISFYNTLFCWWKPSCNDQSIFKKT